MGARPGYGSKGGALDGVTPLILGREVNSGKPVGARGPDKQRYV